MMNRYKYLRLFFLVCLIFSLAICIYAEDWPQFRGLNRDGKSPETGLLKKWPEKGPELLHTIKGVGEGYSSPSIADGKLYITGKVGGYLKVFCFDLSGKKIWEQTHGPAFTKSYPGARAAVTLDGEVLYLLSGPGLLAAYRIGNNRKLYLTDNSRKIWSMDIVEKLGGRVPVWGYSEGVLVDGNQVIVTPGGEKTATFAALDKRNGRVLWTTRDVKERAEYSSPILIEQDKIRQIISMTRGGLIAISPVNGKLIWRYNRPANRIAKESYTANCNTPVYEDGYVFEATGYQSKGGGAVKLTRRASGIEAESAWDTRGIVCGHGGYVLVDGFIYTNNGKGWSCVELKTGRVYWTGTGPGKGSVIYADGMLYCFGEKGKVGLLEANPDKYRMVSSFQLPRGKKLSWAHPVISDGKLYLRWDANLYVYDISMGKTTAAAVPTELSNAAAAPAKPAEDNLLPDASFEDEKGKWRPMGAGTSIVEGSAHDEAGSKCLKIEMDPSIYKQQRYQNVEGVKPGDVFDFSCWIKTEHMRGTATLILKFWTGPKKGKTFKAYWTPFASGNQDWRKYEKRGVVAPPDFNGWCQIVCFKQVNSGPGTIYFDDVSLVRTASNKLENPGFEEGSGNWQTVGSGGSVVEGKSRTAAGGKCLKIVLDHKTRRQEWYQDITGVKAGDVFDFSCWMKAENVRGSAAVHLRFWVSEKKFRAYSTPVVTGTRDWKEYVKRGVKVPRDFNGRFQIVCCKQQGGGPGTVYFDDLFLMQKKK